MFRRANAENHLLIVIVTFAATVLLIRGYLYVTGYPSITTGELHIAHMLWGGIALFIASTLLLLYRSLYLSRAAAVLTGVGWGFFIDEIGKFITESNDYFFAPAAVIIYVVFLIVATIYIKYFRPSKQEPQMGDREAFADIRELLDGVAAGELTHRERQLLEIRVERLTHDNEKIYRDLGHAVEAFIQSQPVTIKQQRVELVGAIADAFIQKIVASKTFVRVLVGLVTIDVLVSVTTIWGFGPFQGILEGDLTLGADDMTRLASLVVRMCLQAVLIVGLTMAVRGDYINGRRLMIGSLLFMIIILDSIDFYFGQFSTAYTVALDVFLLAMVEGRFGSERLNPRSGNETTS